MTLRTHGLPVGLVTSLGPREQGATEVLKKLCSVDGLKIVVLCMHSALLGGSEQTALLSQAWAQGLADGGLVFLPYHTLLFALPYRNRSYPALGDGGLLQEAYDAVLAVSLESGSGDKAFEAAGATREVAARLEPERVSPLFGTIYDAVVLLAHALNRSESHGAGLSGAHLGDHTGSLDVAGFSQRIRTDEKGRRLAQYIILDTDGRGSRLVPTHFLGTSEQPPGGLLALALACVLVLAGGALTCLIRLGVQQLQLTQGPQRVLPTAQQLPFVHRPPSRRRLHVDSASESRSAADGGSLRPVARASAGSLPVPQEPTRVALYQGEWVWLKKFEADTAPELQPSCLSLLRKMRELQHENNGTFLGFFVAPGVSALVMEHCARGSLEDLLQNEALRLDWTFKASLLLDLIHGVRYLHHRHFPHGRLKSRNCVVDGGFVRKITEHGYAELLGAQRAPRPQPAPEELLWTAPELPRGPRAPGPGTLKGGIFSVGIILQEVLTRGLPYGSSWLSAEAETLSLATLDVGGEDPGKEQWSTGQIPGPPITTSPPGDLSPTAPPVFVAEIIRKAVSPPPLCRPLVSPDHGPPECIQLMEQCWEEAPEDRPNLDQICSQFKSINQGKKTSVADSMLRMLEKHSQNLEDLIQERTEELELERQKTERLLSQMLPLSMSEALKMGLTVEPEYFDHIAIYFSDIVGFTTISALSEPIEVVGLLNDLYTLFDAVQGNHDVYKHEGCDFQVETIGDAYMVALGLPQRNGSRHVAEIANMALDILSSVGDFQMRHAPTVPIRIRAGLHSPYRIHVSRSTMQTLLSLDEGYKIDTRGQTELKGKGFEETYWLAGKAGFPRSLPTPLDMKPG
ncbi:guanylate cyclase D-like [Hippopotamus amphibius kiboko]|uniref:guanylate cyclase D-like n=1 Tax=Hippopotamus amphibius kiboko TaxID=575201 RepID=UPI0025915B9E|nr:guanylate cyclase D-like [Hippopotamus amphibius kiboko]